MLEMAQYNLYQNIPLNEVSVPYTIINNIFWILFVGYYTGHHGSNKWVYYNRVTTEACGLQLLPEPTQTG